MAPKAIERYRPERQSHSHQNSTWPNLARPGRWLGMLLCRAQIGGVLSTLPWLSPPVSVPGLFFAAWAWGGGVRWCKQRDRRGRSVMSRYAPARLGMSADKLGQPPARPTPTYPIVATGRSYQNGSEDRVVVHLRRQVPRARHQRCGSAQGSYPRGRGGRFRRARPWLPSKAGAIGAEAPSVQRRVGPGASLDT